MVQHEHLQDLHRLIAQWYREHGTAQTVAEVEQLAKQVAQAAGAAVVKAGVAAVAALAADQRHRRGCKRRSTRWSSEMASLLRALKRMKPTTPEQHEAIRRETGYFTRNPKRMQYARFSAQSLMIGSGPVEAACKVVVGQRLKQAGMRWSEVGADNILALRTRVLNCQWDVLERAAKAA